ncbi:LuxR C-terminal-related transcriptional regulator [Streptomyces sp. NPDC026206]|uniref:response regulator transcription factor n=1 Tax=Streptomyces sp. NPDC026206 TaxID=3157089 RepID=UPI003404CBEB
MDEQQAVGVRESWAPSPGVPADGAGPGDPATRLRVLWLAHDEIAFYGLPALLDRVPVIGAHRVCQETGTAQRLLQEEPFDVCVLPLTAYSHTLDSLLSMSRTRLVLSLSDAAPPFPGHLAYGKTVDAWLLEQHITLNSLWETFTQLVWPASAPRGAVGPDAAAAGRAARGLSRVTDRERSVLRLLAQGQSNQQIARALGISIHGVKRHVSNLLLKFDCSNRTEVALAAAQLRLDHPSKAMT